MRSFYTYAIPFQDTGVRLNYAWSDTLYTELYIVQGWNVTSDNNSGKSWGPSVGWTPTPWLSIVANYLEGPEQNNNTANRRKLFDMQLTAGPFNRLTFMLNYDRAREARVPPANGNDARWYGTTLYARYKINDTFEPTVRIEDYRDPDGFTTGLAQTMQGYTLTWNTKVAVAPTTLIMLRPEVRYDRSTADFFTNGNRFRSGRSQLTYGIGATLIF
ncbi:outer membrane beta-barrel protein [Pseudoduganella sp. UC29_106]|uniref:outer membrane beta-barrel protein n=1 Tax=Pseudoduganella sp. UC29_106 TaxID=3374553 RepID=UPI003756E76D